TFGFRIGNTLLLPRSVPSSTMADAMDTTRAPLDAWCRVTTACTLSGLAATRTSHAPLGKSLPPILNLRGANHTRIPSLRTPATKRSDVSLPGATAYACCARAGAALPAGVMEDTTSVPPGICLVLQASTRNRYGSGQAAIS